MRLNLLSTPLLSSCFCLFLLCQNATAQLVPGTFFKRSTSAATFVQGPAETSVFTSASSLVSPAFSSATTTGNALICYVAYRNSTSGTGTGSITSVVDNHSNTFTQVVSGVNYVQSTMTLAIYAALNITGGTSTKVTVTFSGSTDLREVSCHEFSGISGASDSSGITGNSANASTFNVAANPTTTKSLIYAHGLSSQMISDITGFTNISSMNGDPVDYKIVSTQSSFPMAGTISSAGPWTLIYATFPTK